MNILGIDPGTKCGYAIEGKGGHLVYASGVFDLRARRHEGGGMRYLRFLAHLKEIVQTMRIDAVAYEEVRHHQGVDAAHVYGGIIGVLSSWAEESEIPYKGVPVGTIKRVATGKGNSKKTLVEAAAVDFWPKVAVVDDNHADALWTAFTLGVEIDGWKR